MWQYRLLCVTGNFRYWSLVAALLKEIDSLAEDYLNNVRTMSGEQRKEHLEKIEKLFSKSKEFGAKSLVTTRSSWRCRPMKWWTELCCVHSGITICSSWFVCSVIRITQRSCCGPITNLSVIIWTLTGVSTIISCVKIFMQLLISKISSITFIPNTETLLYMPLALLINFKLPQAWYSRYLRALNAIKP